MELGYLNCIILTAAVIHCGKLQKYDSIGEDTVVAYLNLLPHFSLRVPEGNQEELQLEYPTW